VYGTCGLVCAWTVVVVASATAREASIDAGFVRAFMLSS
jgi:hypothetical protein